MQVFMQVFMLVFILSGEAFQLYLFVPINNTMYILLIEQSYVKFALQYSERNSPLVLAIHTKIPCLILITFAASRQANYSQR